MNDLNVLPRNNGKNIEFLHKDLRIKLIDFGLAHCFGFGPSGSTDFCSNKYCGKPAYRSPEIVGRKKLFDAKSNDVWGLGVCLFMMILGTSPWDQAADSDPRFAAIKKGQILQLLRLWDRERYVDKDLLDLFSLIFRSEEKRITLEGIKRHQWFK